MTGTPSAGELRLLLELDAGTDVARGTVGPADGSRSIRFQGWIGLMSAISELRSAAMRPAPGPGQGEAGGTP